MTWRRRRPWRSRQAPKSVVGLAPACRVTNNEIEAHSRSPVVRLVRQYTALDLTNAATSKPPDKGITALRRSARPVMHDSCALRVLVGAKWIRGSGSRSTTSFVGWHRRLDHRSFVCVFRVSQAPGATHEAALSAAPCDQRRLLLARKGGIGLL